MPVSRSWSLLAPLAMSLAVLFTGARGAESQTPLQHGDVVLLDFGAAWCGPCKAMAPVVGQLGKRGWLVRHVDVDREPDLVRRFAITGVPCFVLLVKGEEKGRVSGVTTLDELEQLMAKSRPSTADAAFVKAAAAAAPAVSIAGIPLPTTAIREPLAVEPAMPGRSDAADATPPARIVGGPPAQPPQASAPAADRTEAAARSATSRPALEAKLLAASARLRVEDAKGVSWGTGTVIDCRQGESLILTCGHIFRSSQGRGRVEVDLFASDKARGLAGQVIAWDLKRDLALVSVFTEEPVLPARVGGVDLRISPGDEVATVGCNGGEHPTIHHSRVTGIDKYLGPANLQVAGQPVQGRSGGGLFATDGTLIGVCNAADPADNEGLFAALPAIHDQLEESGLGFVYRSAYPSGGATQADPLAAAVPNMPAEMPAVSFDRRDRDAAVPTASTESVPPRPAGDAEPQSSAAAADLTQVERALLDHVRRHRGTAEVICIVRGRDTPDAESEVFVLQPAVAPAR